MEKVEKVEKVEKSDNVGKSKEFTLGCREVERIVPSLMDSLGLIVVTSSDPPWQSSTPTQQSAKNSAWDCTSLAPFFKLFGVAFELTISTQWGTF